MHKGSLGFIHKRAQHKSVNAAWLSEREEIRSSILGSGKGKAG